MSRGFLDTSAILRGLNLKKTYVNTTPPESYVVSKFFELGPYPIHNSYNNTYQCSCPICREGTSFGKKRRCFFIPEKDLIYCHNCGWSSNSLKWIVKVSGMSYNEVYREISNESHDLLDVMTLNEPVLVKKSPSLPEDCINLSDPTQLEYYKNNKVVNSALDYLIERRLSTAVNKPDTFYVSLKDYNHKNRLIIPFLDTSGKCVHYQSRKMFDWDEKPNYLSKINSEKSIFGIERVDDELDDVFIFEGPFDACFVKNGLAVAGINESRHLFTAVQSEQLDQLKLFNKIWILDNQWIDETARSKTRVLLEMGECVFIWPSKFKSFKDFNDLCICCNLDEVKHSFIKKHSTCGAGAVVKFNLMFGKL